MTIKEITELRKSGRLEEAMAAAENEFAQNANRYTVSALFWCLNEKSKRQQGDEVIATFERMKSLYENYCPDDEFMQKSLASLEPRTVPHYRELDEIVSAKGGSDAVGACREVLRWHREEGLDSRLYPKLGWLIYYALRQLPGGDALARKSLLNSYFGLNLPKPSSLHSCILAEAIRLEKDVPLEFRIRDFIHIWGLENLREEDWKQFSTANGNVVSSNVEKLIAVYAKELKTDGVEASQDFSSLVDRALTRFPKNENMPLYKATVLISQGRSGEAVEYYKKMILGSPSKYYLWQHIAELVDEADIKVGLLCKALMCGDNDEYVGSVRLSLAHLLSQRGMAANAKYELERYQSTYQRKGWGLKSKFWEAFNPLAGVEAAADNSSVYAEYGAKAEEFIYSSLPSAMAVKVGENLSDDRIHQGRKILTWILRMENGVVRLRKPHKFGLGKRMPDGTAFDVKLHDGKIVWISRRSAAVQASWLKDAVGNVALRTDKNGKTYAIVAGAYVGERLLKGVEDGAQIKILSIRQDDGRWSAIKVECS